MNNNSEEPADNNGVINQSYDDSEKYSTAPPPYGKSV